MRSNALLIAALAACNPAEDPPSPKIAPVAVAVAEKPPVGVPHGGQITHVAVTEAGDAAVTFDNLGDLRLWPTLDGKHEPVSFTVNGADALAIAHAGDELLVGVVDQAGAGHLVRFSRAGVQRAKLQLPGDVAIDQIVAFDNGMLVARSDQSIERYDATGVLRGRIAADASTSFGALAARHGVAAVLLSERETSEDPAPLPLTTAHHRHRKPLPPRALVVVEHASALRWIDLDHGHGLAWGETIAVPKRSVTPRALAISPSHKRVLLANDAGETHLYEVGKDRTLVAIEFASGPGTTTDGTMGLVDDEHAVTLGSTALKWMAATPSKPEVDPWKIDSEPTVTYVNDQVLAIADGMAVSAVGTTLVKQDARGTTYLGWREVAAGSVIVAGASIGIVPRNEHIVWLDRNLQVEKEVEITDLAYAVPSRVWWVDQNHAVLEHGAKDGQTEVTLVDLRHHEVSLALGTYRYIQAVQFDPGTAVLALVFPEEIRRFKIDVEHDTTAALATLTSKLAMQQVKILDPARANGLTALNVGWDSDGESQFVVAWHEGRSAKLVGKKTKLPTGAVISIDDTGIVYRRTPEGVVGTRDGKQVAQFPAGVDSEQLTTNVAGDRLASIHGAELAVYDPRGVLVWRQDVWGAQSVQFIANDARLLVRTGGGLLVLDAVTGNRLAAACGFAFGLTTKAPVATALNVRPVCEDSGT